MYGKLLYPDINQAIEDSLKDITLELSSYKIKIKKAEVFGSGKYLMVKLGLKGSIKGDVFLKGIPVFDKTTNALRVEQLEYDLNTEEALLNAASWFFESAFTKAVEERLSLPLQAEIDQIPDKIQEALEKQRLKRGKPKKFSLVIEEINVDPQAIVVGQEAVHTLINVKGKAGIQLEKL